MLIRRPFLMPEPAAPEGGGAPPAPEGTAKITLPGGVVVEVPKAAAEAFHAAAQKANQEREELARRAGAAEAERKAAAEEAARKAAEAEAIKAAKDGEVERAREILSREANARLDRVAARLVAQEVEAAARRCAPGIAQEAAADMLAIVGRRAAFDADTGRVVFRGEDGKTLLDAAGQPVGADAFLTEWLAARPHFRPATVPAPTAGGAPPRPPATPGTIRLADVPNLTAAQAADLRAGRLKVVE